MKNKNLFLKFYIPIVVLVAIAIVVLSVLGDRTRVGYLGEFKFEESHINKTLQLNGLGLIKENFTIDGELDEVGLSNYIFTNENITNYSYGFRIKYYDKVFRNSDIYGVYIDINKIIEENSFIKEIKMDYEGSPFGNLISTKIINEEKIDNINYNLKIKQEIISMISVLLIVILFLYLLAVNSNKISFKKISSKDKIYLNKKITYILIAAILIFSLFIRIYWASKQDGMYWDEYHSISIANKGVFGDDHEFYEIGKYKNIRGDNIIKNLTFDDSSLSDCINDLKNLYFKGSKDHFISNLYYTLLRLSFVGREFTSIKNIIITGTILNCLFFIISFVFLYKILKLIFDERNEFIVFSLLIISLSPISISFSMFLRAYQMQETFFIVVTYTVINTIYNKKYSIRNLLLTSIIAGVGYLTLFSSLLFTLILSAMLFINYLFGIKRFENIRNKYPAFNPLLNIESYKTIIYYAICFISALFVSEILYNGFFYSLFRTGEMKGMIRFSNKLYDYINDLSFNGLLTFFIAIFTLAIVFHIKRKKEIKIIIKNNKLKLLFFIILLGVTYAIFADLTSIYKLERYSAPSYILILFFIPAVLSLIYNSKIRTFLFIVISMIYLFNITNPSRLRYFEVIDKNRYVLKEDINVYIYNTFFNLAYYPYEYINTNLYYTMLNNIDELNSIRDDKFYLMMDSAINISEIESLLNNYNFTHLNEAYDSNIYELNKK